MKRVKIIFVLAVLAIIEIGFALLFVIQYKKESNSGQINSIGEFLLKNVRYLRFIPVILGIVGPLIKSISGWILTACIFYLLIIVAIATGIETNFKTPYDVVTYVLLMAALILPLIIMEIPRIVTTSFRFKVTT